MIGQALFGERARSKIAAVFDSREEAERALARVQTAAGFGQGQLQLIAPHEKDYGRKLEPESQGVARTGAKAHLILGTVGFIVGLVLWGILYASGWSLIRSSPLGSGIAIVFLCTMAGLMLGGLMMARPDHQRVIQEVRAANEAGKWSLVIHPLSPAQHQAALETLDRLGEEPVKTL